MDSMQRWLLLLFVGLQLGCGPSFYELSYAMRHKMDTFTQMVAADQGAVNKLSPHTQTSLLHEATSAKQARFLLDHGADISARNHTGTTPLHQAALRARTDVVAVLLERGADVNALKNYNNSPLVSAASTAGIMKYHSDRPESTLDSYKGKDRAALERRIEIMKALVKAGTKLQGSPKGRPPLVEAINSGFIPLVKQLLALGAKPDAAHGDKQTTPIWHAARKGRPRIIGLLLERGADPNVETEEWMSRPIMTAAYYDRVGAVRALLAQCVVLDLGDKGALARARKKRHVNVVKLIQTHASKYYGKGKTKLSARARKLDAECASGSSEACARLGDIYRFGKQAPRDPARAAQLYRRACSDKASMGCFGLAYMLANGVCMRKDPKRAALLYDRSCKLKEASACNNHANMMWRGEGVKRDRLLAILVYHEACKLRSMRACSSLANFYRTGQAVRRNLDTAAKLAKRACGAGHQSGCVALGKVKLARGDKGRAFALFDKACQRGSASGCFHLALAHEKGQGTKQDVPTARRLFDKACKAGNVPACGSLGYLLLSKKGGPPDVKRGLQLLQQGCRGKNGWSCWHLGNFAQRRRKGSQAVKLFTRACELDSGGGCVSAARMLRATGKAKAKAAAAALLQKGCKLHNHPRSCLDLSKMLAAGNGVKANPARVKVLKRRACKDLPKAKECAGPSGG